MGERKAAASFALEVRERGGWARAGCARLEVGGDGVGCGQDWLHGADAAQIALLMWPCALSIAPFSWAMPRSLRLGVNSHMAADAPGVVGKFAFHLREVAQHDAGVVQQRVRRRREFRLLRRAADQRRLQMLLKIGNALAHSRRSDVFALGGAGDALLLAHRGEQLQGQQIKARDADSPHVVFDLLAARIGPPRADDYFIIGRSGPQSPRRLHVCCR